MQIQVEEANARVIKEQEAARKAIEDAPPVIKETPVVVQDTTKIDALTAEVESLMVRIIVDCNSICFDHIFVYMLIGNLWKESDVLSAASN